MMNLQSMSSCRMGKVTVTHLATVDYEVQDVRCCRCSTSLGWTYLKAFNEVCTCCPILCVCNFSPCGIMLHVSLQTCVFLQVTTFRLPDFVCLCPLHSSGMVPRTTVRASREREQWLSASQCQSPFNDHLSLTY